MPAGCWGGPPVTQRLRRAAEPVVSLGSIQVIADQGPVSHPQTPKPRKQRPSRAWLPGCANPRPTGRALEARMLGRGGGAA